MFKRSAQRDSKFRIELLRDCLEAMLSGEITLAKTILRAYINATVGFAGLVEATHIPRKASCACLVRRAIRVRPISLKS
jgi:hypothetical protein